MHNSREDGQAWQNACMPLAHAQIHLPLLLHISTSRHPSDSFACGWMHVSRQRKEGIGWPGFIVETQSRLTWAGAVPPVPEASEALQVNRCELQIFYNFSRDERTHSCPSWCRPRAWGSLDFNSSSLRERVLRDGPIIHYSSFPV